MAGTLKICLDAGHYGHYNSNTNVTPVYWESLMAWELHLLLKAELEKYVGVTVITTRADQTKDMGLESRGRYSRGCDLFISLHSNSCDTPSVDRPVVIYPVSGEKAELASKLAQTVKEVMQTNDPSRTYQRWNSAHNADYHGVIRGAASVGVPGLIIEHSFHSNNRSAKWLQSTANLRTLAEAEAAVLAEEYGLRKKGSPFSDVPEDRWSYDAICRCYDAGIMKGTGNGKFSPAKTVTREQLAVVASKLMDYADKKGGG